MDLNIQLVHKTLSKLALEYLNKDFVFCILDCIFFGDAKNISVIENRLNYHLNMDAIHYPLYESFIAIQDEKS